MAVDPFARCDQTGQSIRNRRAGRIRGVPCPCRRLGLSQPLPRIQAQKHRMRRPASGLPGVGPPRPGSRRPPSRGRPTPVAARVPPSPREPALDPPVHPLTHPDQALRFQSDVVILPWGRRMDRQKPFPQGQLATLKHGAGLRRGLMPTALPFPQLTACVMDRPGVAVPARRAAKSQRPAGALRCPRHCSSVP